MPWRELKPMDLKVMFIADYLSGRLNFSQLCAAHSISRKTGYKWVARYNADSVNGLAADQSLPAASLIVPYAPRGNAARDAPRSDGAGGSKAAGELPLGLLSGEERAVRLDLLWELACRVAASQR